MKVKICGITCLEDALAAVEYGADAIGFVFAPDSPRKVSVERAHHIISKLPPFITTVGLLTGGDKAEINDMVWKSGLDMIQFHGDFKTSILQSFSNRAIQVVKIKDAASLDSVSSVSARAVLLDTYHEKVAGGSGHSFHWEIAKKAAPLGKIILAGGLTPDNVQTAIRQGQPYAVDVSSGVEAEQGKKDFNKMKRFIQAAKEMEADLAIAE